MSSEPVNWITINGKHIPIFEEGYNVEYDELSDVGYIESKYLTKVGAKKIQQIVNPNYREDDMNCGKCALAYALREFGFDVEALNGQEGGAFFDAFHFTPIQLRDNFFLADKAMKSFQKFSKPSLGNTVDSVSSGIFNQVKKSGDGSVFILAVYHKNGGGHALNVVNKNGKVIVIDSQTGHIIKTKKGLKEYIETKIPEMTSMVRVDNVSLYDDWQDRCKNDIRFKDAK